VQPSILQALALISAMPEPWTVTDPSVPRISLGTNLAAAQARVVRTNRCGSKTAAPISSAIAPLAWTHPRSRASATLRHGGIARPRAGRSRAVAWARQQTGVARPGDDGVCLRVTASTRPQPGVHPLARPRNSRRDAKSFFGACRALHFHPIVGKCATEIRTTTHSARLEAPPFQTCSFFGF
jgi:hypothetical protein